MEADGHVRRRGMRRSGNRRGDAVRATGIEHARDARAFRGGLGERLLARREAGSIVLERVHEDLVLHGQQQEGEDGDGGAAHHGTNITAQRERGLSVFRTGRHRASYRNAIFRRPYSLYACFAK